MAEEEQLENQKAQVEIARRLQLKWLERMEKLIDGGELSATDSATLARVLMDNGWSFDPASIPQSLRDKLTSNIKFDDDMEEPRMKLA